MPKRELRPEEKILKALWGCSYSSEQLSEKFGIPPQTVSRACKSLEAFNLIRKAGGSWEICCLNKKTKKVLDKSNATFEDILSAYKRKLDVRNLFDGYKSYSGK